MRINPALKALLLGVAIGLFTVSPVRADDVYGRIRGTVTDPSGAVIPSVPVTVRNVDTGVTRTTTTATDGNYELLNLLAPAIYTVSVEHSGFMRFEATNIHLALTQIYVLNIKLELGQTTQRVTVEAASAQVESTSMQLGANLTGSYIVDLPLNGRNWVDLQTDPAGRSFIHRLRAQLLHQWVPLPGQQLPGQRHRRSGPRLEHSFAHRQP